MMPARINWMLTTEKARVKMGRAYPKPAIASWHARMITRRMARGSGTSARLAEADMRSLGLGMAGSPPARCKPRRGSARPCFISWL